MNCTMQDIIIVVSRAYKMTPEKLLERTRRPAISQPRQVAMWIARNATKMTLTDIAERLGGFHHTTVIYGIDEVDKQMAGDAEFGAQVRAMATAALKRAAGRGVQLAAKLDQNTPIVSSTP